MKKRSILLITLALFACALWVSCNDDDNDNNNSANNSSNTTDNNFVEKVIQGNFTEVNFATMASEKASDSSVRAFANQMITEHNAANDELKGIASGMKGINPLETLDETHLKVHAKLDSLSGSAFDSLYLKSQLSDHQLMINFFESEIDKGSIQRVKDYASKYLPAIREHYAMADSIYTKLTIKDSN